MEKWRDYFDQIPEKDLWTICERALAIAYLDHPDDFPSHRDRFAQKLYSPEKLCAAMEQESSKRKAVEVEKPKKMVKEGEKGKKMATGAEKGKEKVLEGEKGTKKAMEGERSKRKAMYEEKEDKRSGLFTKIHGNDDDVDYVDDDDDVDVAVDVDNDDSNDFVDDDNGDNDDHDDRLRKGKYDEAEALTDEMEEEILLKCDLVEIKESLLDSYKSEAEVFDSLQRLELMQLSFDVLKETEIGKTVNTLRKHSSGRVRALAKKLVSEWKDTAEHWYKSVQDVTAAAKAGRPLSIESPLDDDEDGLPSPPMDEGALLAGRTASLEMYQLFDFMDDETSTGSGNPNAQPQSLKKSNGHIPGIHDGRRDSSGNANSKREKDDSKMTNGSSDDRRQSREKQERKAPPTEKQVVTEATPPKASRPCLNPSDLDQRLVAAKKKLQENYQQAENAKRQRTIQVMGLEELPMGGPKRAKASQFIRGKPLSHHRPQSHGRR